MIGQNQQTKIPLLCSTLFNVPKCWLFFFLVFKLLYIRLKNKIKTKHQQTREIIYSHGPRPIRQRELALLKKVGFGQRSKSIIASFQAKREKCLQSERDRFSCGLIFNQSKTFLVQPHHHHLYSNNKINLNCSQSCW